MTAILEKTAGLVAFVRTIDLGSFSKAARLLGSSPSAVSKSVARLEKRLGARLIQRSTRILTLTAEGAAYYERVAPLLRAIEDAEDVVQIPGDARGLLRVTAAIEVGRTLIAQWVRPFVDRHPRVKLELSVTDRHVDMVREGYDIAIRMGVLPEVDLVVRKLADLPVVLVASPTYIERHGAPQTIDDLRAHACLRYILGHQPYPITFADGTSIIGDGPLDTDDGATLRRAALSGAGIAHLMTIAVSEDLASGRLVRVLPDVAMPTMPVYVLHAFGRQLPIRARLFIDFLIEQAKEHAK